MAIANALQILNKKKFPKSAEKVRLFKKKTTQVTESYTMFGVEKERNPPLARKRANSSASTAIEWRLTDYFLMLEVPLFF